MLISVVICTYDRADLLSPLLMEFAKQCKHQDDAEVLVIDNNSTDETHSICSGFIRENSNFRYIQETKQGLSYARNAGIDAARGSYVCFIDDDCFPCDDWVAVAREIISKVSPGVFGGPYFAKFDHSRPAWFKESYESHDQGSTARPLNSDEYLDGGNCCFRKSLLVELGGFNVNLGMIGNTIAYGEETELLIRIRKEKPDELIYYDPRFFVYNLVRPSKMNLRWLLRQRFISGMTAARIFPPKRGPFKGFQLMKELTRSTAMVGTDLLRAIFSRDRNRYPYIQNYLLESTFEHVRALGMLYGQHRLNRLR